MGEPFRGIVFQEKRKLITKLTSRVCSTVHEITGQRFYKNGDKRQYIKNKNQLRHRL
jgi:hypothetical protein